MLSILRAVKHFRSFLQGRRFTVITDHRALLALQNKKEPTGRLARWAWQLMTYDFAIVVRKGDQHSDADAVSRLFLPKNMNEDHVESTSCSSYTNIDDAMKSRILEAYHCRPDSGGHLGISATYRKIAARFAWKGMRKDIDLCHAMSHVQYDQV